MARKANYDKFPAISVPGHTASLTMGYDAIIKRLRKHLITKGAARQILVLDTYPGVDDAEITANLINPLKPTHVIQTLDLKRPEHDIAQRIERHLTDDRIFGVLSCHQLEEFFDPSKLEHARAIAANWTQGLLVIYGVGAALVTQGDCLVLADMARWEIQQRYRQGMGNWGVNNGSEDFFRKYKRAFFVEWRVADRHKFSIFNDIDYLLDTNQHDAPKLLAATAVHAGLKRAATQPFRLTPFFDPAPWGGQWMRETCDLDCDAPNFGWCFDCVPEENSLMLEIAGTRIEMPALNLVYRHPVPLLGDKVHARFGCEFPIRFDFLDTIDGGNLSFQVHPLTEYIQKHFGMHYTQDESYYILAAKEDATVYLGLKTGIDPGDMIQDLYHAQTSAKHPFPAEKYVNQYPAKVHDHFLIPAGTPHCSGRNSMVLEISATPYIFTFKMWDWGRLGLDGQPRPVHLEHALANIQWERDTSWVNQALINRVRPVASGEGWREEQTGLHAREFIETRRHWFTGPTPHDTAGGVNVLNLVQGDEAVVESPYGVFEPFVVHYAETFIIPASVGAYTIRPLQRSNGVEHATIKAYVRV